MAILETSHEKLPKRQLSVFVTSKGAEILAHTDLLVYSHCLFQDVYRQQIPTFKSISLATGISEKAVSARIDHLTEVGLIEDGRAILPENRRSLFALKANRKGHPSNWPKFWKTYVRAAQADNPLTVACVSVFSYLYYKTFDEPQPFTPKNGWSAPYLAKVLLLKRETVDAALAKLNAVDLLQYSESDGKLTLRLYDDLDVPTYPYFASKTGVMRHPSAATGQIEVITRSGNVVTPAQVVAAKCDSRSEIDKLRDEATAYKKLDTIYLERYIDNFDLRGLSFHDIDRLRSEAWRSIDAYHKDDYNSPWRRDVDAFLENRGIRRKESDNGASNGSSKG